MRLQVRRAEIAGVEAKAQTGSKLAASWLLASVPVSLPLEVYGTALFGMFLVVLGCVLWLRKDTTTEQSPRVR